MFVEPKLQQALERVAVLRKLPAGAELMRAGDPITHIPIVRKGSLRILAQDPEGRERFLYHIMPGETCALSLTCCATKRTSSVMAVVEEEAELWMVPVHYLEAWMDFPEWRKYVNDTQAQRFNELLETIEVIAFNKLDEQLWNYLVKRVQATGEPVLKVTHLEIANELDSPREVITRLLHQLQARGLVAIGRGTVEVKMGARQAAGS